MIKCQKNRLIVPKKSLKLKMITSIKKTDKLQNLSTALSTCWAILSRLLHNKKIPAIPPLLVDGKIFKQIFYFFNNFFYQ